MKAYPFGFACYPSEFLAIMVSENKLCMQFKTVDVKLRTLSSSYSMLPKDPTTHQPQVPVSTNPSKFEVVAIGCQLPVIRTLQLDLLQNTFVHAKLYPNSDDIELLIKMRDYINNNLADLLHDKK